MYEMCLIADRFSAVSLLTEACSEGAGDVFCPPKIRKKKGGGEWKKIKIENLGKMAKCELFSEFSAVL